MVLDIHCSMAVRQHVQAFFFLQMDKGLVPGCVP